MIHRGAGGNPIVAACQCHFCSGRKESTRTSGALRQATLDQQSQPGAHKCTSHHDHGRLLRSAQEVAQRAQERKSERERGLSTASELRGLLVFVLWKTQGPIHAPQIEINTTVLARRSHTTSTVSIGQFSIDLPCTEPHLDKSQSQKAYIVQLHWKLVGLHQNPSCKWIPLLVTTYRLSFVS